MLVRTSAEVLDGMCGSLVADLLSLKNLERTVERGNWFGNGRFGLVDGCKGVTGIDYNAWGGPS